MQDEDARERTLAAIRSASLPGRRNNARILGAEREQSLYGQGCAICSPASIFVISSLANSSVNAVQSARSVHRRIRSSPYRKYRRSFSPKDAYLLHWVFVESPMTSLALPGARLSMTRKFQSCKLYPRNKNRRSIKSASICALKGSTFPTSQKAYVIVLGYDVMIFFVIAAVPVYAAVHLVND